RTDDFGDQEGFELRRQQSTPTIATQARRCDTNLFQLRERTPLVVGAHHRQAQLQKILEDLTPGRTTMALDEVALPLKLERNRLPLFERAMFLAFDGKCDLEGILAAPGAGERFIQPQLSHASTPALRHRESTRQP